MRTWRYIEEDKVEAHYGLATDEFLMSTGEITLRLYTYKSHCALVGRFQHIEAELDLPACRRENIAFSRRLTGGGAIIMGEDQLGVCLTAPADAFPQAGNMRELYHLLSAPILAALQQLGITAGFWGKNDLVVDGRKIAGLGIYASPEGTLQFHASVLLDLDIPLMLRVLKIPMQKLSDKQHIGKVEERMATVSGLLGRKVASGELRQRVKRCFAEQFGIAWEEKPLSTIERVKIIQLAFPKYAHEDWIFQQSPQPDMTGMGLKKTAAGLLRAYVALKGETIKSALITGDFLNLEALFHQIEAQLKWSPLDQEHIGRVIDRVFAEQAPEDAGVSPEEVRQVIWRAALGAMKEVQYTYRGSCYYPKTSAAITLPLNIESNTGFQDA